MNPTGANFTATGNLLISARRITNSGLLGAGGNLRLSTPGALINQGSATLFAGGGIVAVNAWRHIWRTQTICRVTQVTQRRFRKWLDRTKLRGRHVLCG